MLEELELDTEAKVKAFTHPYRMKLLHVLKDLREPATATDVARALGDGPGKSHYHMRILESAGIVVLSRTEVVNGIIARYYEPAAKRFNVKGEALGSGADAGLRDDVAKLITMRFRDGLKAFLERTTSDAAISKKEAAKDTGGFLYDCTLYCSDEDWAEVQATLESITSRFEKKIEGVTPRKLFLAGASDLQARVVLESSVAATERSSDATDAENPPVNTRWTFGITLPDSSTRFRPFAPPAE